MGEALNRWIVTPRMHGIHHSIVQEETDSNWSSGLTIWDRLHGTLRLNVPQDDISIGVPAWREPIAVRLPKIVRMPFERCLRCGSFPKVEGRSGSRLPAGRTKCSHDVSGRACRCAPNAEAVRPRVKPLDQEPAPERSQSPAFRHRRSETQIGSSSSASFRLSKPPRKIVVFHDWPRPIAIQLIENRLAAEDARIAVNDAPVSPPAVHSREDFRYPVVAPISNIEVAPGDGGVVQRAANPVGKPAPGRASACRKRGRCR